MDLQSFINQYNGQRGVGNTTENKGECVGLVMVYLKDYLKFPHIWGNAEDLIANSDKTAYETTINNPNDYNQYPQRGDIICWNDGINGTVGHTAIVTRADGKTFEVFEQNMPTGAGCRLHTYPNYAHVDGWISPKVKNQQAELDKVRAERDRNWNLYIEADKKLKAHQCPPQRSYEAEKKQIIDILNKIG